VDRRTDRLGDTLEQYMGKTLHTTLEWLHKRVADGATPLWEEILEDFHRRYDGGWNDSIRIVKKERTREGYRGVGERCLRNYFEANTPFDEGSLVGTEWDFRFRLGGDDAPVVAGKVDRISRIAPGYLQVHDYKSSMFVKGRDVLERSRQPGLYAMAVRRAWPDAAEGRVELVWHYLTAGIVIRFEIPQRRLEWMRRETAELIAKVEAAETFEARPSKLCGWCEYNHVCPEFGYREKVRGALEDREDEPGVALVDRLERLVAMRREFERAFKDEKAGLERAIAEHARQNGVGSVVGTSMEAVVTGEAKVRLRKKR
jgi:hypothetical protein